MISLTKDKKMVGVFEPIDWESPEEAKYIEELDIEGKAKRNGKKGLPFTDDTTPDSAEISIKVAIDNKIHQATLSAQKQYDSIASSIESLTIDGLAAEINHLPEAFDKKVSAELSSYREDFNRAKEEADRLENDYELFRKENGLRREASYPESMVLFAGLIFVVLILESAANAWFFAQGNDFGLLGGGIQASIVSIINLIVGGLIGALCLRQMNHIQKWRKYVFGIFAMLLVAFSFIFNLLVGHYRAALSVQPDDAKQLAISGFRESVFGVSDWDSWVLIFIGIFITFLVALKSKSASDAYPGYKKRDKAMKDAKEYLSDLVIEWHSKVEKLHDEYLDNLDDLVHDCRERADRLDRSHRSIKQQVSILDRFVEAHKQVYISCVRTYRQINKQNREDPAPTFFNDQISAEFEHNFNAEIVSDTREHTKARKDAVEQSIPAIKSQLLHIYKSKIEEL